jgi:hypothetical protein
MACIGRVAIAVRVSHVHAFAQLAQVVATSTSIACEPDGETTDAKEAETAIQEGPSSLHRYGGNACSPTVLKWLQL